MKQFRDVNTSRGAPMGRPHAHTLDDTPKSIQLFRVRLCAQGYDDGGAYWGHSPEPLWCARDSLGNEQFIRHYRRITVAAMLEIPNNLLKRGISPDEMNDYFRSFCENRMPPRLLEFADWEWWFEQSGYKIFDGSAKHDKTNKV